MLMVNGISIERVDRVELITEKLVEREEEI